MKKINNINLIVKCDSKISINKKCIKEGIKKILEKEDQSNLDINIIFVDNKQIKDINLEYRNKNYSTDVISFPFNDEKKLFGGDIFISLEKVKENAKKYGISFRNELKRILVHGVLHILGYDHIKTKQKKEMFKKQENYINFLYRVILL